MRNRASLLFALLATSGCGVTEKIPPETGESMTITSPTAELVVGGTVQLTAVVRGANGNVLAGHAVTWGVADPTRATVSPAGVVRR